MTKIAPCATCGSPVRLKSRRVREAAMAEPGKSATSYAVRVCVSGRCPTNLFPRERTQGDV